MGRVGGGYLARRYSDRVGSGGAGFLIRGLRWRGGAKDLGRGVGGRRR